MGALLLVVASGCTGPEPLRVAFMGPTSGPGAAGALAAVRAVELVLDGVNAAGGVDGRRLDLVVYDDGNDPERARANAAAIVDEASAIAVIDHSLRASSVAAGPVFQAGGLPVVTSAATSVTLTQDSSWYFRTIYNDRTQGRALAAYVRYALAAGSIGIVHDTEPYGAYLSDVIQDAAAEVELEVGGVWAFDPDAADLAGRFEVIAAAATEVAPQVLLLATGLESAVELVKLLRDRDFGGEIMVADSLASQAFAAGFRRLPEERSRPGFYTDGIYAAVPFLFDGAHRRAAEFAGDFTARFDEAPDWHAALAADAAMVVTEALRRAQLSVGAGAMQGDRAALRAALADIGPVAPVAGITGPIWFDSSGDVEKPVPMGLFLNGDIVSAFAQLSALPAAGAEDGNDQVLDPARLFSFGDQLLYRTELAHVGARARRFDEQRLSEGLFEVEFDIWFRHQGDRDVEDIVFTNAVNPVELGDPVDEHIREGRHYRLFSTRGLFRADTNMASYREHILSVDFRHRERDRLDLILAFDPVGMNLSGVVTRAQRVARGRDLLGADSAWAVSDVFFDEEVADEPTLGHPDYLHGARPMRHFSKMSIGVVLKPAALTLRGSLPAGASGQVAAAALVASLLLFFVGRRTTSPQIFGLQAGAILVLLVAVETPMADWALREGNPRLVTQLSRAFDLLWWLIPALLLVLAIERLGWRRAEERSGTQVPSLLRWSVASTVFLLASFGVVAFVYGHTMTGLLATSGVVAMIVGLAIQLNITNLFAGVALNLERPFAVGDWIMIHGRRPEPEDSVIGMVIDINWRTTRLRTTDGSVVVIPNGSISEKTITNFMRPGEASRFALSFTVDERVPTDTVIGVIREAVGEVTGVDRPGPVSDPAPSVRINRVTEMGIEYTVRYWIVPRQVSPHQARHIVNESVLRGLCDAGIGLAHPRRVYEKRTTEGTGR